jgi:hypothetical protein
MIKILMLNKHLIMENNNRQGCRWTKASERTPSHQQEINCKHFGHPCSAKYWDSPDKGKRFFDIKGSQNIFFERFNEIEWLDESIEPCATSSENYWKQRCEAAEAVIEQADQFPFSYKDFNEYRQWQQLKSQTHTGDRDCEELNENLQKRISELEEENNCLSEAVAAYKADFDKINIPTNNDWQKNIDRDSKPNNF